MSSAPDTWMPLYIGDYLADTMHLSAEEHGAYMLLIMHYWRSGGPIRDDDALIQTIARIKPSRVSAKITATVRSFFTATDDGFLRHTRIDRELAKASENKQKQQARTAAATEARKNRTTNVTTNVTSVATLSPSPSPLPVSEVKKDFSDEKSLPPADADAPSGSRAGEKNEIKYSQGFERFWTEYPKTNGSKSAAYTRWKQDRLEASTERVVCGLGAYLKFHKALSESGTFAPQHPFAQKWLKERRWENEYDPKSINKPTEPKGPNNGRSKWTTAAERYAERALTGGQDQIGIRPQPSLCLAAPVRQN